jgi:hypothetical protein
VVRRSLAQHATTIFFPRCVGALVRLSADLDLNQIAKPCDLFSWLRKHCGGAVMTTLKTVTIAVLLVGGTSLATAQNGPATGGQVPVAGGAGGGWYPGYGYGYGYAAAPLYDYAAPAYGYAAPAYSAPATAGTTIVIVTPGAPAYTAPPVGYGYYNYAPGYWGGYRGWRAGW